MVRWKATEMHASSGKFLGELVSVQVFFISSIY